MSEPIPIPPAAPPSQPYPYAGTMPPGTLPPGTLPPGAYVPPGWSPVAGGPPQPWPGDPRTQSLPAGYVPPSPPGAIYPYAAPTPPKKRRTGCVVFSVVGLLLLLLAVSGVAVLAATRGLPNFLAAQSTPAPTVTPGPTATPAPPAGYSVQTDAAGYYRLYRPSAWTKTDQSSGDSLTYTLFTNTENGATLGIETIAFTDPNGDADNVDSFFEGLGESGKVTSKKHGPDQTVGGVVWAQGTATETSTVKGAPVYHVTVLITTHDAHTFVILRLEPTKNAATTDDDAYATALSSFTFLK